MASRLKTLEAKLDARKRKAAYLLVENELRETGEKRTQEEIAEEVGVTSKTIWSWKTTDPVFLEYKNALADDFLSEKRAYVYGQMMKLIGGSQPSVKAIDLFLRRFGLLTEKQVTITEEAGGSRSNEDLAKELEELDDLLNDE
jgi:transcription initiation factor TFIIIB Brf1 subunit/transcription initiation factor TFIIB